MVERTIQLAACELIFLDNDIVQARFNADRVVGKDEVQAMFETMIKERKGRKSLFLVSVDDGTTLSGEGRAHASSKEASEYIVADAIIVRDFTHQLSANAFIRHNKPARPIRTFEKKDNALEWLLTQQHLLDGKA